MGTVEDGIVHLDFFGIVDVGIVEFDPWTGRLLRANPAFCKMLGYQPDELVDGRGMAAITHPDDLGIDLKDRERLLSGEKRFMVVEKRCIGRDGRVVWCRMFPALTRDPAGTPRSVLAMVHDITGQRQSDARLLKAIDFGEVGAWDWDLASGLIVCTPAHRRLFGLHPDEDGAGTCAEWLSRLHPDDRESATAAIERAKARGRYADQFRVVWPDGGIRWLAARGRCEMDANGKPVRMLGVNIDITSYFASEALNAPPGSLDRCEFSDRKIIFRQGDRAVSIFQVTSGTVKIYRMLQDGRTQILGFQHAGSIIGFPGTHEYTYCAEALGNVTLRRFPAAEMEAFDAPARSIAHRIAAGAINGLIEAQEHVGLLSVMSARERLLAFLLTLPTSSGSRADHSGWISLPMSRQEIGDYLVLRRETVSRVLNTLKDEGLILLEDGRLKFLDPDLVRGTIPPNAS